MNKQSLKEAVQNFKNETKIALETVYLELNRGQRRNLVNNEKVRKLFDKYGVEYEN